MRTNRKQHSFIHQLNFFCGKLRSRGYDLHRVRKIISKYPWSRKAEIVKPSLKVAVASIVPLKLPYSPGVDSLGAARVFTKHLHLLPAEVQRALRPIVSLQTAPNLFRLRYSRFCWTVACSCEHGRLVGRREQIIIIIFLSQHTLPIFLLVFFNFPDVWKRV